MGQPIYKRSELNAMKEEYCDTLPNGIIVSVYDVKEYEGEFDNAIIVEDEEGK